MKAIILAAGKGTRLWRYTRNVPKCMLKFKGKTIIERQVETLRANDINEIIIVKGYKSDKIQIPNIKYYTNTDYENTNMVHTLFCAKEELIGDVIVSYADILYESRVLKKLIKLKSDTIVTVDIDWKKYWTIRYGNTTTDTESLVVNEKGYILDIGQIYPPKDKINGRYVGLLKFSSKGIENVKKVYYELRSKFWNKQWPKDKLFQQAYMTDIIQTLIDEGIKVKAMKIKNGWLEFDTNEDYEKMIRLDKEKKLKELFDVNK